MKIKIRQFQLNDTKAVAQLWRDCGLISPQNDPIKDIKRKLKAQPELFLIAVGEGKLVGTVMGGYEGHRGWINYLAVEPSLQRSGIGRQLMAAIEKKLAMLGCPKINLQVRRSNSKVRAFYEKIGYLEDQVVSYGKRLIWDR